MRPKSLPRVSRKTGAREANALTTAIEKKAANTLADDQDCVQQAIGNYILDNLQPVTTCADIAKILPDPGSQLALVLPCPSVAAPVFPADSEAIAELEANKKGCERKHNVWLALSFQAYAVPSGTRSGS